MAATLPHLMENRERERESEGRMKKVLTLYSLYLPVAVVGGRPHGENRFRKVPLVAFHHQLVSSTDHLYVVGRVELQQQVSHSHRYITVSRHQYFLNYRVMVYYM